MASLFTFSSRTVIFSIGIFFLCISLTAQPIQYPSAKRENTVDTYHGTKIADPYQWMENLESKDLSNWMLKQERLYYSFLKDQDDLIQDLKTEISEQFRQITRNAPVQSGNKLIFTINLPGESNNRLYVQQKGKQKKKELLNFNALNDDLNTAFLSGYSPAGRYVTYSVSINKSRYYNVRIHDVENNSTLPEEVAGVYGGRSFIAWNNEASGFFYSKYPEPEDPQAPLTRPTYRFHKAGTSQEEDILIYENPENPSWIYRGSVSYDDRYLILAISDPNHLGNKVYVKDLKKENSSFIKLVDQFEDQFSFLYKEGKKLYFRTTNQAPNHRIVAISIDKMEAKQWEEVVPESEQVISRVNVIGSKLLLLYNRGTRNIYKAYDKKGKFSFDLEPNAPFVFFSQADRASKVGYMTISTIAEPVSVYEVDLKTGKKSIYSRVKLSVKPEDIVVEHVNYPGKDGTKIPMRLVYKKGLKKDGKNPVFIYGYGAFNFTNFPWQTYLLPWITRGGIYALPNIRGGGIYGKKWYEAGSRHNKVNTINDYIAAAEWLVESNYTSKGKIVANGGSASGLLPAIAVNQRPDLYGASIIDYPVIDMLRYHKFGSANWTSEFGNSDDPEDFKVLASYSPYHNLNPNQCYPPTMVQVGEKDNTTTPMHGYKYTAALQHIQDCGNPVLLKISRGAGHSLGATREDRIQTEAEQIAFLIKVLGL